MDPVKILKRAWHILWSYRALWVFGLILAMAGAGSSGSNGSNSSSRYEANSQSGQQQPYSEDFNPEDFQQLFKEGAERSGQDVYLCWQYGEEHIEFWHGIDDGFAGRQSLDEF